MVLGLLTKGGGCSSSLLVGAALFLIFMKAVTLGCVDVVPDDADEGVLADFDLLFLTEVRVLFTPLVLLHLSDLTTTISLLDWLSELQLG